MRKVLIPKWHCDYCNRCLSRKKSMIRHEDECISNPAKRSCKTCRFDHKERHHEDCYCEHPDGDNLRGFDSHAILCRSACPAWEPKEGES